MDKVSYALGLSIGNNFLNSGISQISTEDFVKGLSDVLQGLTPSIDYDEAQKIIKDYFVTLQKEKFANNKSAGEEFLKVNGNRSDVTTLPSGVQYRVLSPGDGEKPKLSDQVKCHYHGTLINGVVFDSSVERGEPATFPVNGVIKGWQEILQIMPVGAKWRVTIPYNLAYGEQGAGGKIEPFSTLNFDIELLEIVKK